MRTKKWTTREGAKVRVCDMGDRHLVNTIAFLNRRMVAEQVSHYRCPPSQIVRGELALEAAEEAVSEILEGDPGLLWPIYYDMVSEAEGRGLEFQRWSPVFTTNALLREVRRKKASRV